MDVEKVRELLEQKEKYLRELAVKLSGHIQELSQVDEKISTLEEKIQLKNKKLKHKESQIEQEMKDKEIIITRIKGLEELLGSPNGSPSLTRSKTSSKVKTATNANYIQFYTKLKNEIETNPSTTSEAPAKVEEKKDAIEIEMGNASSIIEEEVDISKELEALGLGDLVKKYNK
ncbi:unnamed protein product [Blepharisma stoltei]|uniref:Uncharacterized protein n=1 Tax=Blepharisma stoltei TaxID=1481888 RepID=A0AAU9KDA5_9CILI|nr:unnamed protein product [Blepharisma stoltei]